MERLRRAARGATGGLPSQFWAIWAATLINRAGSFVILFLALYLTTQRHFSPGVAGLVVGLYGAGGAVGVTIGGFLTDRWGRRPTALLSLGTASVLMVLLGLANQPLTIMAAATALGFAAEAARPPLGAMIADIVPDAHRMRAFSAYFWAVNLGFAGSAILAGFAAQAGYLMLFILDAVTTAAAAILLAVKVPETRPAAQTGGEDKAGSLRTVLADRTFMSFVVCNLILMVVLMQHASMLPIAMGRDGLSSRTFGLVIALNGILIVLGQMFVTRLLRDRRPARVIAVSAVVMGAGFGLTAVAHTPLWYAATVVVWTFGEMLNAPSNATLLASLSPVAMRGRYQGVYSLSWQIASFVAPVLGGYVQQEAGGPALWLGCLALGLIAGAWNLAAAPARERRGDALRVATAAGVGPNTELARI
ncbi:MFS transporter [Planosporangium flavigriseum]|uniref:MFS transporter n=1 Tax=Planosporangium flavigriseum TaxID=373681 RepID=A0A8J3LII8_9ACTN|nr:MFS transporter [Planosporangium flavigriseum]NJC63651.1 MFS transporter [Planosporangium flavigriseum]GIG72352.1 MFS transporter [Planosporangium flavigriseum]